MAQVYRCVISDLGVHEIMLLEILFEDNSIGHLKFFNPLATGIFSQMCLSKRKKATPRSRHNASNRLLTTAVSRESFVLSSIDDSRS